MADATPKKPTALIVGLIGLALIALGAFGVLAWQSMQGEDGDNTTTNTAAVTNVNSGDSTTPGEAGSGSAGNTNTAATNTNTSTTTAAALYEAPVEPFTTSDSTTVAFAYKRSSDQLVTRFTKVNAKTGAVLKAVTLSTAEIQTVLKLPITPPTPSLVRFGSDGDSILFALQAQSSSYPFVGLYRSSFSTPTTIDTIVQYDTTHLVNGDLPRFSDLRYNAQTNQAAFVIPGDETGERNGTIHIVNLATKAVRPLGSYPMYPQLVGFPSNGAMLEVLYQSGPQYVGGKNQKVQWSYDIIRLEDAKVITTQLLLDETTLDETNASVSLTPDSISPNNMVVAFNYYASKETDEHPKGSLMAFRTLETGTIHYKLLNGGHDVLWSSDSGQVIYQHDYNPSKGTVYDLAKGDQATVTDFSAGYLWYPGNRIIFSNAASKLVSYDPSTKKTVTLTTDAVLGANGGEYGYGSSPSLTVTWVNR